MDKPYVPEHYGENLFYTDDVGFVANLIDANWSLEDRPKIYFKQDRMARENYPYGSIYVYTLGKSPSKVGINYDAMKMSHRICIDVQNPENRERHYNWLQELYRIFFKYRRAGRKKLQGYDYIELPNEVFKHGYVNFYHSTFEINLVTEARPIFQSGFGDVICEEKDVEPEDMQFE